MLVYSFIVAYGDLPNVISLYPSELMLMMLSIFFTFPNFRSVVFFLNSDYNPSKQKDIWEAGVEASVVWLDDLNFFSLYLF